MNLLFQPCRYPCQFARTHFLPHREILFHIAKHLCTIGTAEGIGWKIAERTAGPMGILQTSSPVIRHIYPQIFFIKTIPNLRNILHFKTAVNKLLLNLITHHHMQRIGKLISLCPDQ